VCDNVGDSVRRFWLSESTERGIVYIRFNVIMVPDTKLFFLLVYW